MRKKEVLKIIFLTLVLTSLGYLFSYRDLDPDFGWHLKTGELILERGVPKVDWYSFTMSDFPWINHEWLTDILIYKLYSLFGYKATLLFFLILVSLAFLIFLESRLFWYYFGISLLGFLACSGFLGARPQLITILFIALLWKGIRKFLDSDRKLIYFCPFLFLFWVNLHGGFSAGIFLLFLVLILELFKKSSFFKKINSRYFPQQKIGEQPLSKIKTLFFLFLFSFLATLINPYGLRIYEEVWRSAGDYFLTFHIAEWLPLFFGSFSLSAILFIAFFLSLCFLFHKKIDSTYLIVLSVFFFFALFHQRHFFIFIILSLPLFAELLFYFWKEINLALSKRQTITNFHFKEKKEQKALFKLLYSKKQFRNVIIVLFFVVLVFDFHPFLKEAAKKERLLDYPSEGAISYLATLPLSENLLNEYGWGGYLIWKLPQRKLFIDGRMPSWRKGDKFVFGDFIKIMEAEGNFSELLEKYKIKIILLKKEHKEKFLEKEKQQKERQTCSLFWGLISCQKGKEKIKSFFLKHPKLFQLLGLNLNKRNLYEELIKRNWKEVYEDETVIILRKTN